MIRYVKQIKKETMQAFASYTVGSVPKRCLKTENRILLYVAGAATLIGGILHLMMIGPSMKPSNFPMELLPYTDGLFIIAGIAQIFWTLPMIKNWNIRWYYIGIVGTIALTALLILTRVPNQITGAALQDKSPMALLTELSQLLYIGITAIIITREKIASTRTFDRYTTRYDNTS
jgi:hypothetical protein